MVESLQVTKLEPPKRRFANGKVDPSEAGRIGAQRREENRLARLSSSREYVERVQLPKAIQAFDELLADEDPRARRYRYSAARDVLAGTGTLSERKQVTVDLRAEISALIAAFKETPSGPPDARRPGSDLLGDPGTVAGEGLSDLVSRW
jgi:hypothetical protein